MSGVSPPHRAGPDVRLAVGLCLRPGGEVVPRWCVALLESIRAHPALALHACAVTEPVAGTAAPAAPRAAAEALVRRLLTLIDRPRWAVDEPVASERVVDALRGDPEGVGGVAAALRADPSDPRTWAGCEVVLELEPEPDAPAGPSIDAALAPGTRLWRLRARRIEAEIEAALLGWHEVSDLVLHEIVATAHAPDARERVRAVHALPAQSFSRRDRLSAAFGALPDFVTTALVRLARDVPEPAPDAGRLDARRPLLPFDPEALPVATASTDPGAFAGPARGAAGAARRRLLAACRVVLHHVAVRVRDRFTEERWELAWHPEAGIGVRGDTAGRATGAAPGRAAPSRATSTPGIDALLARPVAAWHPLLPDAGRIRAEPHALARPGGIDLWYEDRPDGHDHAHIGHAAFAVGPAPHGGRTPTGPEAGAVAEGADAAGARPATLTPTADSAPATAMSGPRHLSYPFVFENDGVRLMVPETGRAGCIELYHEDGSPRRWRLERTLIDGLDTTGTTLVQRDGRWWLFTSAMSHAAVEQRDMLLLHHADTLHGPWTPHPLNPIVRGVEGARMAGALFELDGVLVRPSQYGGRRYGHGLELNRIDTLDPARYAETRLGRIRPAAGDGWLGLHTISRAGGVAFVDRLRRRPRPGRSAIAAHAAERLVRALDPSGRGERTMR